MSTKRRRKNRPIPSAGPSITEREVRMVADAARAGWYENRNNYLDRFVKKFAALTKRRYVLPVAHCTDAIHLALLALDINKGDEVIVPDVSWIASASPITYVGARPVFADIDPETWCLSPTAFERAITSRTKAIIVVDLLGTMPHMREILTVAKRHRIAVIEDAAEALGSSYRGRPAGSFGDISVMSFNATKLATAGQGGTFATNDKKLYDCATRLIRHGMVPYTPNRTFWSETIGYNYEWTNMHAAFALAQLERLPELLRMKRRAYSWYKNALERIPGVSLNPVLPRAIYNHWLPTILIDRRYRMTKERILARLEAHGIAARPLFYPMSMQPAFQKWRRGGERRRNPVAYDISARALSLPSSYALTERDVREVSAALRAILRA